MSKKVAVVLSGCGVYDGSEITESIAIITQLSRNNIQYQSFAPNINQYHVVNHLNGEEIKQDRNVMQESARIVRGNCKDLADLNSIDYDALIIPGGFGAAKNLSNYAYSQDFALNEQVLKVIKDFHQGKKVIGACCISPILLSKAFENQNVKLTLGQSQGEQWPYCGTVQKAKELGSEIVELNVDQILIDEKNKIVTTPAYMYDGKSHQIFDGVCKMVDQIKNMI